VDARARFAELCRRPDAEIPLAEAALWIAAESCPGLDVPRYLHELDALAARSRGSLYGASDPRERVLRLNHALFSVEGFAGNEREYDDPRNSYLNEVLERRTGLPITLSIVYVEVARRLGLEAAGVGFPGHFLAKVAVDGGEVIVDPFSGRALGLRDCAELLRRVAGDGARLEERLLEATPHRDILLRVLANLKHAHVGRRQYEAALACCERILLVAPDAALELRDRGLVYRQLECHRAALADLERFLALRPDHETAPAVRDLLPALRERARAVH
jgi:regulator of sirC expression with transglutaminase-like and TPR domain